MNFIRITNPDKNEQEYFQGNDPALFLGDINELNIIVGANNSRKSRFLRHIIRQEHQMLFTYNGDLNQLYWQTSRILVRPAGGPDEVWENKWLALSLDNLNETNIHQGKIKSYFHRKAGSNDLDALSLRVALQNLGDQLINMATHESFQAFEDQVTELAEVINMAIMIYQHLARHDGKHMNVSSGDEFLYSLRYGIPGVNPAAYVPCWTERLTLLKEVRICVEALQSIGLGREFKQIIYIPVLRTARRLEGLKEDLFQTTIKKQYHLPDDNKVSIETGLALYEKIGLARNGSREDIRNFNAFEKFVGDTFYQGQEVHIVARRSHNAANEHIHISLPGELEDISIHDLGDGVQSIIAMLLPIFTARDGSWVLIDEPEDHLHPGYQLIFIQALAANEHLLKKGLKYFINTHSNHILSEALLSNAGLEIFVFNRKDEKASLIKTINGNEHSTLEMLGVLNTSVLISNCTLWVEGITDRLYLKAFLFAYLNHLGAECYRPKEGLNYAFIEYGGKNLAHYSFDEDFSPEDESLLEKIDSYFLNSNVFVLADHDMNDEKHEPFLAINRNNFRYRHTVGPEIENLLPPSVWGKYFLEEVSCDPEKISEALDFDNKIKLGAHFQGKIFKKGVELKIEKLQGNGTLEYRYKRGIAGFVHRKVMAKEILWPELEASEPLRNIVGEIYQFIAGKNYKGR
ncbi:AAA family ATPase [Mucilaginibacter sp. PAMB04168]|uniref:AAA family ATPase n=1 Tax=Mucilaginibacter sp. PAMB04168 TaxID=3138567 RepID=UPI0031F6BA35